MSARTVLLVGTADTKSEELAFMRAQVLDQGMQAMLMDVGVRAAGDVAVDIDHDAVASAAGTTIAALAQGGDENAAMTAMARGAAATDYRDRADRF